MAKRKSKRKLKVISVKVDLDAALGRAHREQYLRENGGGFVATKKVHKNKAGYSRKQKHPKKYENN